MLGQVHVCRFCSPCFFPTHSCIQQMAPNSLRQESAGAGSCQGTHQPGAYPSGFPCWWQPSYREIWQCLSLAGLSGIGIAKPFSSLPPAIPPLLALHACVCPIPSLHPHPPHSQVLFLLSEKCAFTASRKFPLLATTLLRGRAWDVHGNAPSGTRGPSHMPVPCGRLCPHEPLALRLAHPHSSSPLSQGVPFFP